MLGKNGAAVAWVPLVAIIMSSLVVTATASVTFFGEVEVVAEAPVYFHGQGCPCHINFTAIAAPHPINLYVLDDNDVNIFQREHKLPPYTYPMARFINVTDLDSGEGVTIFDSEYYVVIEIAQVHATNGTTLVNYEIDQSGNVGCITQVIYLIVTYLLVIVLGLFGLLLFLFLRQRRNATRGERAPLTGGAAAAGGDSDDGDDPEGLRIPPWVVDSDVKLKQLFSRDFPKPRESLGKYWRHLHSWVWPWCPFADEILPRRQRLAVFVIQLSVVLLINTVWAPSVSLATDAFSEEISTLTSHLQIGHYVAVLPVVSLVKLISGIAMVALFRGIRVADRRWATSSDSWRRKSGQALKYTGLLMVVGVSIICLVGLFNLANEENCSKLIWGTLMGFVITELMDSSLVFIVFAVIYYYALRALGKDAVASSSPYAAPASAAAHPAAVVSQSAASEAAAAAAGGKGSSSDDDLVDRRAGANNGSDGGDGSHGSVGEGRDLDDEHIFGL